MRLSRRAKRRWIALAALVLAGSGGAVAWRTIGAAQAERLLDAARAEGLEARRRGDDGEALARLSYYYARRKNDVEVMLAFADVRARIPVEQGRHLFEAAGLYRRVLLMDPVNREAITRLLELSATLGDRIEAAQLADRLLSLEPGNRAALAIRLADLQSSGRLDEALQAAGRLVELEPDDAQWRLRTLQIMERRGASPQEMIALADRWVAERGAAAPFLVVKSRLLLVLGRRDEAAAVARAAAAGEVATQPALEELLALLDDLGLRDLAAGAVERAIEALPESAWVWQAAALRQWQSGRLEQSLETLAAAEARLGQADPALLRLRVLAERALGRRDDARRSLESLRAASEALDPDSRSAWLAWSTALAADLDGAQSWAERKALLDRAMSLRLDDAAILAIAAEGWAAAGELEQALAALEGASRLDPDWIEPAARRAAILLALGRASAALQTAVALLRQAPQAPASAWLTLARAWLESDPRREVAGLNDRAGAPVDLVGLLESLWRQGPSRGEAAPLLVEAYLAHGRRGDAEALLDSTQAEGVATAAELLALAQVSARNGLGRERTLIDAARAAGGDGLTLEVAEAAARLELQAGRAAAGLAMIDEAIRGSAPLRGGEARRLRAAYLVAAGDSGAMSALADLLGLGPDPASGSGAADAEAAAMAVFVLSQPAAWSDTGLVRRAVDVLAAHAGQDAPRVRLARATLLLRDPARGEADLAEAMVLTGDVLASSPDSLAALTLMSALLMEGVSPDPVQAMRYLQRAVETYPGRLELYPRLIALLQRMGDFPAAEPLLEHLGALSGGDPALLNAELRLLQAQGDFDRAVVRLSAFVGGGSREQEQVQLARLLERAGKTAEAGRIYDRLLAAGPVSLDTAIAAADFRAAGGRVDEAIGILEEAAAPAGGRGESARLRGSLLRRHGELDAAALLLEQAVADDAGDASAWGELARLRLARADFAGARSAAEAALVMRPDDAPMQSVLAVASLDLDEPARRQVIEALGDAGDDPVALGQTLELLRRGLSRPGGPSQRDIVDAGALARRLAGFLPAWRMCVTWTVGAGLIDEAVGIASEAAGRLPSRPEPAEWATRVLLEAGRDGDALDMAYAWRRRMGHRPFMPDMLISALELAAGRPHEARLRLEPHEARLLAARDRWPQRVSVLLGALIHDGELDRASALLNELMGSPGDGAGAAWIDEWLAWTATAPPEIAARALDAVEPQVRREPGGLVRLARGWAGVARRGGAAGAMARADALAGEVSAGESAAAGLALRAGIAVDRGDDAAAEGHCRALLELVPDDVDALNTLAWLLSRRGAANESMEFAERAAALAPGDADVMDTWATALYGGGRLDEAEHAARRARSLRGDDPALGLTLARILLARGRLDEAETELARVERQIEVLPPAGRRALEPEAASLRSGILRARTPRPREHAEKSRFNTETQRTQRSDEKRWAT